MAPLTITLDDLWNAAEDDERARFVENLMPLILKAMGRARSSGPRLLRAGEAARRVGFSANGLTRAAREGRVVGAQKVANEWRFDPTVLEVIPRQSMVEPQTLTRTRSPRRPARKPSTLKRSSSVEAIRGLGKR